MTRLTATPPDTTRREMSRLTESHVTSRDRPRQPDAWRWPRRRVIWNCDSARGPLLTRYYLFDCRWFGLYVHQLHTSDDARAMHDHPWSFVSFLFHRGYNEITPTGIHYRPRFSILWRPAEFTHRLGLTAFPTWTLVLRFPRRRRWGFWLEDGTWQSWQRYGKDWCD